MIARNAFVLVPGERVAAEQPVLQSAPRQVFLAVQIDDDAVHQPIAGVVQGLTQVATAKGVACVGVVRERDHRSPRPTVASGRR